MKQRNPAASKVQPRLPPRIHISRKMSPMIKSFASQLASYGHSKNTIFARDTTADFQSQWQNPSDILSLLMILGPDVVWRALAQLCGEKLTPVVFSYGWVGYAVNALVAAFGGMCKTLESVCLRERSVESRPKTASSCPGLTTPSWL